MCETRIAGRLPDVEVERGELRQPSESVREFRCSLRTDCVAAIAGGDEW